MSSPLHLTKGFWRAAGRRYDGWFLHQLTVGFCHRFSHHATAILRRDFAMDTRLVDEGQLHRLLTACFLHNSVFHILFNLGYLQPSCNTWGRRIAQCPIVTWKWGLWELIDLDWICCATEHLSPGSHGGFVVWSLAELHIWWKDQVRKQIIIRNMQQEQD